MTRRGDVYVTDSFRPTLWHVTAEQVRAGAGTPQALDVSAIPYEAGEFNLNGIVAKGNRKLVVVDTNSGKLFRIALGDRGTAIRAIDEITGATVPGGDGMLLDRGRLVVVQGDPAQLSFLKLRDGARRAGSSARRRATSSAARRPSTGRRGSTSSSTPTSTPAEAVHRGGAAARPSMATTHLTQTPPPPDGGGAVPLLVLQRLQHVQPRGAAGGHDRRADAGQHRDQREHEQRARPVSRTAGAT